MKDVIEEQRRALVKYGCEDVEPIITNVPSEIACVALPVAELRLKINEAFLKVANEADFIINRLRGEAGMIELAAGKMPHTAKLLKTMATLMRGYAARLEDSQAPAFNKKIITLNGVDG